MKEFAALLETLVLSPGRLLKQQAIADYMAATPDPERGWALAALTGQLSFSIVKSAALRQLAATRIDPELFHLSYDFVGDLAETLALAWPVQHGTNAPPPQLTEVVDSLRAIKKAELMEQLAGWMDACDSSERIALLKLVTGNLRIGVGARLVKLALAEQFKVDVIELEEIWSTLEPPFADLFDWLEGRAPRPALGLALGFRPIMLSHPLEDKDRAAIDAAGSLGNFAAEWKWDGIRVQWVLANHDHRIYSRGGEEISGAFPEFNPPEDGYGTHAVLDGELLIKRDEEIDIASFNDLQQRLNRKKITPQLLKDFPAHIRLYDILQWEEEDLRQLPYTERRAKLDQFLETVQLPKTDLSPQLEFQTWDDLAALRAEPPHPAIEGLMLKRRDSAYLQGRLAGNWYKWKRNPLTFDCVVMYAQRGHGKRSSLYSDFTYGAWATTPTGERVLLPVGKAYGGYTDKELNELQKFINKNTTNRFGPVRELAHKLVIEIACDAVQSSNRHKSGVALRFPRFHRIRWDKPPEEADEVATIAANIG